MRIAVGAMERTVDIRGVEIRTQIAFQQIELLGLRIQDPTLKRERQFDDVRDRDRAE